MTAARVRDQLERVSTALGALKSKGNLLEDIAWSRDVEERFFAAKCHKLPTPEYSIDRRALDDESRALDALARTIDGDDPIPTFLRAAVRSAVDRNRMLIAVGTRAFGEISREIYGGARTTFYGLPLRNIDLADHLLSRLQVCGWDEAKDRAPLKVSAEGLAAELSSRIASHRPKISVDVILDDRCASKAIAGMSRVRIRPDATFEPWEVSALYVHEVETHIFTAQNGAAQPLAPFLRSGGPRTTPTQEGLAVFAELHHHALATPRLERLALRVKMVEMAEDGASFLDLYRFLLDRSGEDGESKARDAYLDATRICRGGLVEGGAPFTKDACYLGGLLHVYAFLSAFVRAGFRDELEMLVAGRIALDDVIALAELRAMGLFTRPKHRPSWLEGWSTLLPYFAFSSFAGELDLGAVEAHYRELIAVAEAAGPRVKRRAG